MFISLGSSQEPEKRGTSNVQARQEAVRGVRASTGGSTKERWEPGSPVKEL